MLAAFVEWGLDRALTLFNGMFAFALWDANNRTLHLARDRLGEKPVYYGWVENTFLFGSELKALRAHPRFSAKVDRTALALYLRYHYVPAPYSIFEGIFKLSPGHRLTIHPEPDKRPFSPVAYWSARAIAESGMRDCFSTDMQGLVDGLDTVLRDAVAIRTIADVPLGAFLSGGIDSSTIVALMQATSTRPVKTFTVGFKEHDHNEAPLAASIARYLGTDHTEVYVGPADALSVIPRLPALYDEPFSDASQIPTFLIAQLARKTVTVALTGDGGDEVFGGYTRYVRAGWVWKCIGWAPTTVRRGASGALRQIRVYTRPLTSLLPGETACLCNRRLLRLEDCVGVADAELMYTKVMSCWSDPYSVVIGGSEPEGPATQAQRDSDLPDVVSKMMYLDTVGYLPEDILVKVDRAAMGVSLETRAPYLDPRVIEFAWRLPINRKISRRKGKIILRHLLHRYIPKKLVERPKKGFSPPIDLWIREPLKDWAEDLLNERRLRCEGFFNVGPVRQVWHEHVAGEANWGDRVWNLLMFQAWLEQL
jgi:asparagine synthase (glutamine-hydrolysing)